MTKQIYQPLINALNYVKSIVSEIDAAISQYEVSHTVNFSLTISATVYGGTTSVTGEISETLTLTSEFINTLKSQLNESATLESDFVTHLDGSISEVPTLQTTVFQGMLETETLNATSTADAEFGYLMDFTKNISETISMDKRRTHYVWDGGIILS